MEYIRSLIDFILHIDRHLDTMIQTFGPWMYVILFLIIFAETGLVVTPGPQRPRRSRQARCPASSNRLER